MNSGKQFNQVIPFEPTVPSQPCPDEIAATDGPSNVNPYSFIALAHSARETKRVYPPKLAARKRVKSQASKIGQWVGTLFRGRFTFMPDKKLRIVESVSLGERRFVTILQVEGRKFLIGGSASSVSMLASLDGGVSPAELLKTGTDQLEYLK